MRLIIFDFDGVVADSELIANRILAEGLTRVGLATTTDDALRFYMGRRWADCVPLMEAQHGAPLPADFLSGHIDEAHAAILGEVRPVPGLEPFLARFAHIPRCIASSSSLGYIDACLARLGFGHWFERRFSAQQVTRGKPDPDLFLMAAAALGAAPEDCVVIEDSPAGVMAGKAAGMLTLGLLAGEHILDDHAARLIEAGADHVFDSYEALAVFLAET